MDNHDDISEFLTSRRAKLSPTQAGFSDLVGALSTRSDLFRTLWGAHDVREHRTGIKSVHHPIVGDLDLTYQSMDLASDRGLQMLVFSAEPESASSERLQLLANWAGTNRTRITLVGRIDEPGS